MYNIYFRVSIENIAGTGDADGFIDNKTVAQYMANNGNQPANLTDSENKTRANLRYRTLVEQLQLMGNVYIYNAVAEGATINSTASTFTFTLQPERGWQTLQTWDELNPGAELYGENAVVRCVSRALCESLDNYNYYVYDPTATSAPSNGTFTNAIARNADTLQVLNVAALQNSLTAAATYTTVTYLAP